MANIFGTNDSDFLSGTGASDTIIGRDGDDTLLGADGFDTLEGGHGADILNGGSGVDRASYAQSSGAVTVSLFSGTGSFAAAEGDTLSGIENIRGSNFDGDVLIGDDGANFLETLGQGTLKGLGGDDVLRGGGRLEGGDGADDLRGRDAEDTLLGGDDDDSLDGRGGADVLNGGTGVDTVVYEASAEGVDVLLPLGGFRGDADGDSYSGVENVTGSRHGDTIAGDDLRNELRGQEGADLLKGAGGDDLLEGGLGADTLEGGGADDRFVGGFGADRLDGGAGVDTASYFDAQAAVTVNLATNSGLGDEAQGDTFFGVEIVEGSAFGDALTGDDLANELWGDFGADVLKGLGGVDKLFGGENADKLFGGDQGDRLSGGTGADQMFGGDGDDIYVVENTGDVVDELTLFGTGVDRIESSNTFSLSGANVKGAIENLTLTGSGDVNGVGNALANVLTGNNGRNTLNGNSGADKMIGRGGNDNYVVNEAGDVVDESVSGGGVDEVTSFVTFNLSGPKALGSVENLRLSGSAALNAAGNGLDNMLIGNGGKNDLMGLAGDDVLTGGGGADTFVFNAALNAATNVDEITDFSVPLDTMRLENAFMQGLGAGALAASAFRVGAGAADATDRIVYNEDTGNLFFDRDGVGGSAAIRFAELDTNLALTNADFFVI